MQLMYWLIPALIPLATHRTGGKIDFAAHFGGAIVGFSIGAIILKSWGENQRLPRYGRVATVTAVACGTLILACMAQAFAGRARIQNELALANQIAPNEEFQKLKSMTSEQAATTIAALRTAFPRDPRTHFFSALAAIDKQQTSEAESQLRSGLAEQQLLRSFFPSGHLEASMREVLTRLLFQRGADVEAREALQPACKHLKSATPDGLDPVWVKSVCQP